MEWTKSPKRAVDHHLSPRKTQTRLFFIPALQLVENTSRIRKYLISPVCQVHEGWDYEERIGMVLPIQDCLCCIQSEKSNTIVNYFNALNIRDETVTSTIHSNTL